MKNQKLSKQVQESLDFLNNHPGVCYDGWFEKTNMVWWLVDRCKNGEHKDYFQKPSNIEVSLYKDDKYFDKFWEKYKDEDDDINEDFISIYVPYSEIYGYDWKYKHSEYSGEYCFYKYSQDKDYIDYLKIAKNVDDKRAETIACYMNTCWNAHQGGTIYADSFEELIIKTAEDVKTKYGDFCCEDFLTAEEKQNHKDRWAMRFEPLTDRSGYSEMVINDKYISVEQKDYSLRWWDWFIKTEYCREKWKQYVK